MSERDPETGQFLQGKTGNPKGRPKGTRNQLSELFWSDLYGAWKERGVEAIDAMIAEKPGDFVKVVASQMPKELLVNKSPLAEMSDDELAELLTAVRSLVATAASPGEGAGDGDETETRH